MKRLVKYWFGAVIASVRLGLPAKPTRVLVGSQVPLPSAQRLHSVRPYPQSSRVVRKYMCNKPLLPFRRDCAGQDIL